MTAVASPPERVVLVLDAGQTGTKARLLLPDAPPVESTWPGVRTHAPLMPQLSEIVRALASRSAVTIDVLSVGASGLTHAEDEARALLQLTADAGVGRVLLAHDSVTSYLGAVGDGRGAVVAAGTGVVTLAVGAHRIARVDGWGNIMGDAGSAYWIGREALDAAMRSYDGRSAPTALVDVVRDRWPQLEDAYISLQSDPDRVRIVASFAESVTTLADSDAAAAQISLRAARELALSVSAGLNRVREEEDAPSEFTVGVLGGVFRSAIIRSRFDELIVESWPGIGLRAAYDAQRAGVDGAALLGALPERHPLRTRVADTGRNGGRTA